MAEVVPSRLPMYVYQHHPVFPLLLTCNSAQISKSKIEDRFITYENDALRYAKLLGQIERFESWGKEKEAGGIDGLLQADTLIRCRWKGSPPTGSNPPMDHSVKL